MGKVRDLRESVKDYLEKEDIEFNGSLQEYSHKNPEPKKPTIFPSLIFWFGLICAIAAMGTSGLRVFDRFYQVAMLSGGAIWLANLEAIFGVVAVNFTLLSMAFFIAYKNRKMDNKAILIALVISVFISLTSGLGQSFYGLKMTEATGFFDWVLAFALGAGITGLEYFSGSLLGIEYNIYVYEKEEKLRAFREEHKLWLKGARGQFGGWVSRFHRFAGDDSEEGTDDNFPAPYVPANKPRSSPNTDAIVNIIEQHYRETNELMRVTDIAKELSKQSIANGELSPNDVERFIAVKKGNISSIRKQWAKENNIGY
jgi:hypothetical protein